MATDSEADGIASTTSHQTFNKLNILSINLDGIGGSQAIVEGYCVTSVSILFELEAAQEKRRRLYQNTVSSKDNLIIPRCSLPTYGIRAFSVAGPASLPERSTRLSKLNRHFFDCFR